MKQHKWHKEIKAWADGAEIEFRVNTETLGCDWTAVKQDYGWTLAEGVEYRIKPEPKEPQYLYVYGSEYATITSIEKASTCGGVPYIGKIKLEVDDD